MLIQREYEDATTVVNVNSNGVVIADYNDGYRLKIIADIAVVNDSYGIRVYGASHDDSGTELWCNINEVVGFTDNPIKVCIVEDDYHLPEGEMAISDKANDRCFNAWALVFYSMSMNHYPVLYIKFDSFDESSYIELTSVLSKLFLK